MKQLLRYNIKLLFSPLKWLCCFLFVMVIPIAMYAPTYYDFTNICEMYIPFIGIILITDIMLIDKHNNISEILYVSSSNLKKILLLRYLIITIVVAVFILLADGTFFIQRYFKEVALLNEPITHQQFFIISISSTLLLGTISMTIANILKNQYIGYGLSFVYWLYWMVNSTKQSKFNLFPFVANPTEYIFYTLIAFIVVVLLVTLNVILAKKSPFFISDKLSK